MHNKSLDARRNSDFVIAARVTLVVARGGFARVSSIVRRFPLAKRMRSLPKQVEVLCQTVDAPPRLIAHLTLVHDFAVSLVEEMKRVLPEISLNAESIFFGAATHDIGKSLHRSELSEAGNAHEADGERLLLKLGVNAQLARFARTHAAWRNNVALTLEDLFVSLADTCWKGKRISELETLVAERIASETGKEVWDVFILLDDVLQKLTEGADERLAWQAQFPA